jgi:hypothetical protein
VDVTLSASNKYGIGTEARRHIGTKGDAGEESGERSGDCGGVEAAAAGNAGRCNERLVGGIVADTTGAGRGLG